MDDLVVVVLQTQFLFHIFAQFLRQEFDKFLTRLTTPLSIDVVTLSSARFDFVYVVGPNAVTAAISF